MKKKEEMAWWDFPDYTQNMEKYMDELSSSSQVWTHLKRLSHANGQTEEFPADTGDKNKHMGSIVLLKRNVHKDLNWSWSPSNQQGFPTDPCDLTTTRPR